MPVQNAVLSGDRLMPDEPPPAADDLSALRLLALPDLGPPFDDDPAAGAIVTAETGTVGPGPGNRDGAAIAAAAGPAETGAGPAETGAGPAETGAGPAETGAG